MISRPGEEMNPSAGLNEHQKKMAPGKPTLVARRFPDLEITK